MRSQRARSARYNRQNGWAGDVVAELTRRDRALRVVRHSLGVDPRVATLLPCNVVVRVADGGTVVEAVDPLVMADVTGEPGLADIADDAARRVQAALDTLPTR